jgi:hypothetical protein
MGSKIISIRVDKKTESTLQAAMRRTGASRTGAIVAAIKSYYEKDLTERNGPYDSVKDLVGSVEGPAEPLSENTGRRFRAKLARRRPGRP